MMAIAGGGGSGGCGASCCSGCMMWCGGCSHMA